MASVFLVVWIAGALIVGVAVWFDWWRGFLVDGDGNSVLGWKYEAFMWPFLALLMCGYFLVRWIHNSNPRLRRRD